LYISKSSPVYDQFFSKYKTRACFEHIDSSPDHTLPIAGVDDKARTLRDNASETVQLERVRARSSSKTSSAENASDEKILEKEPPRYNLRSRK